MSEVEMKLPGRDTIEAYISEGGFICLKQESPMGEDPSIVMMLPHDIPQVVEWLKSLAGEYPLPKPYAQPERGHNLRVHIQSFGPRPVSSTLGIQNNLKEPQMRKTATWLFVGLFCLSSMAYGDLNTSTPTGTGVVTAVAEGTLYIGGFAHSIATVETEGGTVRVAVPTRGVMQALQIGESLSFSGPNIDVTSGLVINTREGFIFRAAEKSMGAYMAEQMSQAKAAAEAQMAEVAKTGIPNAVPTLIMESQEQAQEGASKRRMDLLLMVLSILVAVLAFERIPRLITKPVHWIKSRLAKRTDASSGVAAQLGAGEGRRKKRGAPQL